MAPVPAQPQFQQLFGSSLYTLDAPNKGPGWVGFVWCQGDSPAAPATLSLAGSFPNGHYLFAPQAPAIANADQAAALAKAVVAWLDQNCHFWEGIYRRYACFWLAKADVSMFGRKKLAIFRFIHGKKALIGPEFVALQYAARVPAGQLSLSLPVGTSLVMGENGLEFSPATQKISFTADGHAPPSIADGTVKLPFVGPFAGAFTMAGTLSRSKPDNAIDGFATGFHYLHAVPGGAPRRQVYPLFATGSAPDGTAYSDLNYTGSLDPLDLFNRGSPLSAPQEGRLRTRFALKETASVIASWFRTPAGRPLGLLPSQNPTDLPWAAALVLQSMQPTGSLAEKVYLTPAGDFALTVGAGMAPAARLEVLPGLYGSERIGLAAGTMGETDNWLRFVPGRPAHAPIFPFPATNLDAPDVTTPKPRLDTTYTTAWGQVAGVPAIYLAQPEGSALYAPPQVAAGAATVMTPLSTPVPIPPKNAEGGLMLLPIAPYAGAGTIAKDGGIKPLGAFESQILSQTRRDVLGAVTIARLAEAKTRRRSRLSGASVRPAVTPDGIYAEIDLAGGAAADCHYERVVLARSVAGTATLDFGFQALGPELQDLFQTNQLMAVMVNPAKLGASGAATAGSPVFDREVEISGWRMRAAIGEASSASAPYGSILILKYCDGTLLDRVAKPDTWTSAATFSERADGGSMALAGLSSYVRSYLDDALAAAKAGDPLYADFAQLIQDPAWRGFMVLAAKVDPSGFPDELKALVAGIDFNLFQAHHFGATASRISVSGGQVTMETPSSLFGLIDYQLPAYRDNLAAGGYPDMPLPLSSRDEFAFQVLQLQMLFRNAAMVDFRSHIQLTLNTLFLSRVTDAYGVIGKLPAQGVVLDGSYQRHGATPVFVFEQAAPTRFLLDSNVLTSVTIERVVFNTLSDGKSDNILRSRFQLSGALEFACLSAGEAGAVREEDLLSFGLAPQTPLTERADGLAFSGLALSMSSHVDTPNAVSFALEIAKLALDPGASRHRDKSLFADLALAVDEFIVGPDGKRPADFGYLPVALETKMTALSGPWFGIAYKVTMGTPGGLVAGAGFASRLLVAWGPGSLGNDPTAALFVGLQLPGAAPGAKMFSVQGVLKLSIDSLLLRREKVKGDALSFTLRLNNVGLSFLGLAKLPSGGAINFFLFGDPEGTGSLGWYAAYAEKDGKPPGERLVLVSEIEEAVL